MNQFNDNNNDGSQQDPSQMPNNDLPNSPDPNVSQDMAAEPAQEAATADPNLNVIDTFGDAKSGQIKCTQCGSTDISMNKNTGKLRCNFCRNEMDGEQFQDEIEIHNLEGLHIGSGATKIDTGADTMVTLKCQSCAAEVVINTDESLQARCHWCRNTLSLNQRIPNGAVPDIVLPFAIQKQEAESLIAGFVKKRGFFANPRFKREFTTENILGVYLPYMVVDINAHAAFKGEGEHLIRRYTVGSGDDKETYYDAEAYAVERHFDILIDDLTIESSVDKLQYQKENSSNNILNSIMPFDIKNAVKWDANYLRGYNSEKRDTDIESLEKIVHEQAQDVARHKVNDTLAHYNRGVRWEYEKVDVIGQRWISAFLPVWVYSYLEKKGNKNLLHYTAVNARTKETMGSVPINIPKLVLFSIFVEIFCFFAAVALLFVTDPENAEIVLAALAGGPAFFAYNYYRYRNTKARHTYEKETLSAMKDLQMVDQFLKRRNKLKNSKISGANNESVKASKFSLKNVK